MNLNSELYLALPNWCTEL